MAVPLTPESLVYDFPLSGDPQVSPDGAFVLYSLSVTPADTKKATSHVWVCRPDGSDARQLTQGPHRNAGARWSPDGRTIAFISNRQTKNAIFLLPFDQSGESRFLTQHVQSIADLAWAPDGRSIAYTVSVDPENPGEIERPTDVASQVRVTRRIDYKQDNRGYLGDVRAQVFLIDTESGDRRQLTNDPADHLHPAWAPDSRTLAMLVPNRNGMCSQLSVVSIDDASSTIVGPETGTVACWSWSPDGSQIAIVGEPSKTWQTDFFAYQIETGVLRRVTDNLECLPDAGFPTIFPPSQPIWLDDSRVLFHAFRAGSSGIYSIDMNTGTTTLVHDWRALCSGMSADRAGRYVAHSYAGLDAVGEVVVYDRLRSIASRITSNSTERFAATPPATWERFTVDRDDAILDAWILRPADFDPTLRYPLILDVHGGPNGHYGFGFNAIQQALATAGILVVFANPRGSTSYGRDFAVRVFGDWGGDDYRDLMAVAEAACALPGSDSERLGIWGYSYGGYMTAWAIGQTDRFRAAVCGAPCFDLVSMYGTSDIGHFFGPVHWGGKPHEARDYYLERSPSTFAHRVHTPTLIIQGEADDRCPVGQGEAMFVALHEAGCDVEFVRYPGGSHLFLRNGPPEHRADAIARIVGWFKRHLAETK